MELYQNIILFIATILTVSSIVLNNIKNATNAIEIACTIETINAISSFFAVAYIAFDILINDRFYRGGTEKRLDLVDHAFGTNFSGQKSTGYFNAGGITIGIYKLAVLAFENSLFTSEIAKKMAVKKWILTLLISAVFIISACLGNKMLVNNILQIAATGVLLQQTIRLQQFSYRMGQIHSDFKLLFNDLKDLQDRSKKEGEMIRNVLNYEATHSWGSILTNSKIFKKLDPELSAKWEQMKLDYKIS